MPENSKPVALFIGRFQPFHKGHLLVVSGMVKVCRKVIIAIGSSDAKQSGKNPFTVEERREMIQRALQGQDIIPRYDVIFIEVPDKDSDQEWAHNILELAGGEATQIWTGDEWNKKSFDGRQIEIKGIKEVPGISATEVRRLMKSGGDWHLMVPPEVADYLDTINGVERVKKLS